MAIDGLLKKKCEKVPEEEGKEIIKKLIENLDRMNLNGNMGYGLAANQIGIDAAVAYAEIAEYKRDVKAELSDGNTEDFMIEGEQKAITLIDRRITKLVPTKLYKTIKQKIVLINPEVEDMDDEFVNPNEGCLSFPGKKVSTRRFREITIKNFDGRKMFTGLEAIITQHEIDHLNGLTIFDRTTNPFPKTGRNEPCPCKSGKKYKKCCASWGIK